MGTILCSERQDDAVPVVTPDLLARCGALHAALDAEIGVHVIERLQALVEGGAQRFSGFSGGIASDAIVWAIDEALNPAADRISP